MHRTFILALSLVLLAGSANSQNARDYRVHQRGMLWQTVFNTGELGRGYDAGTTGIPNGTPPSMEWPPSGYRIIDQVEYAGFHNSFGGGVYIGLTRNTDRLYSYCGAVSNTTGKTTPVEGVYSTPISLERRENVPVLPNGTLNPGFDPNEAEEIITSSWLTTTGITVSRTSRAWSYPCYNGFIIYEYEFKNTTTDTLKDVMIAWTYGLCPSMFGMQRTFGRWGEADLRTKNMFARYDLKRWLSYNHDRNGSPETDTSLFSLWSAEGQRGGLNSPAAVGYMILHYDYDHLAVKGQTNLYVSTDDEKYIWDQNNKVKQPYLNRYENGNIYDTKVQSWVDAQVSPRKTGPFKGKTDSTNFPDNSWYWLGRVKPSFKLGWNQPAVHGYGVGPYTLPPGQSAKFTIAEVVGYGPGVASDSVYTDMGGSSQGSNEAGSGLHPVPSWYSVQSYPELTGTIGSTYLRTHPLPWYVDKNCISIRDAADRAIQMYTGNPLVKWDSLQFEPKNTPEHGVYRVPVPVPSPALTVENTAAASNKLIWGPQVESFGAGIVRAPLKYYLVYRGDSPVGAWTVLDTVSIRDKRYFNDTAYVFYDRTSKLGVGYCYSVISVDTLGGRSNLLTSLKAHTTQSPAAKTLEKVYVVPNPLFVTNGQVGGSSTAGDPQNQMGFFGLPKKCTIKIFSFSGQHIETLEHNADAYTDVTWFQLSRNHQMVASGVYFFVVEDAATGKRFRGKFVVIH